MRVFKEPMHRLVVSKAVSDTRSPKPINSAHSVQSTNRTAFKSLGLPIGIISAAIGVAAPAQATLQNTLLFDDVVQPEDASVERLNNCSGSAQSAPHAARGRTPFSGNME